MTDLAPVRLGIVGCGGISHRHAPAAAASPEVEIVACCDPRRDVAEDWAATYGCGHVFGDYRSMLEEQELDGVLIATWPVLHCEQILGCLERVPQQFAPVAHLSGLTGLERRDTVASCGEPERKEMRPPHVARR